MSLDVLQQSPTRTSHVTRCVTANASVFVSELYCLCSSSSHKTSWCRGIWRQNINSSEVLDTSICKASYIPGTSCWYYLFWPGWEHRPWISPFLSGSQLFSSFHFPCHDKTRVSGISFSFLRIPCEWLSSHVCRWYPPLFSFLYFIFYAHSQ